MGGELYLLSIESGSELGSLDSSLSQWVVILQEFTKSDSVSHNLVLNLLDQIGDALGTGEVDVEWLISGLSTSVWIVDYIVAVLAVLEEWQVLDVSFVVSILLNDGSELGITDLNT